MTVVTDISLYRDIPVICVTAVTTYEFNQPALPGAFGAVLDPDRLQHFIGKLPQILRDHIRRGFRLRHIGDQLGGGSHPFGADFHKFHNPKKELRNFCFADFFCVFVLHKFPFQILKLQGHLLIFHIPSAGKKRGVPSVSLALEHIIGVRRSGNAGRAAHLVERVIPLLELLQIVDEDNGNVVLVGDPLNGGNVVVIVALHSRFADAPLGIPHLWECVDNHQLCLREVL